MPHDSKSPRRTSSGIEVDVSYGPDSLGDRRFEEAVGDAGEYPFTRGPHPTMYRGRLWTMRQYAGFGSAEATNERFRALLDAGQTGLSVAFDLPTQMGLDSDDALAAGEVGKVGVAVDCVDDVRRLFEGIPLGEVSTSMTINTTAAVLLLCYQIVAESQGVPSDRIRGTVQNDILKEYAARGTYIYPPRPSMRLVTDLIAYCRAELPAWNTISISGYHIREAGSTAAQEIALTLANGLAYVEATRDAGLPVDEIAARLSFFWNSHRNFFEEIAKFRAARRLWARLMRERVGAEAPASWRMRFHAQTAGSTLTAQQAEVNVVRSTLQALSAVLGGTQSLHVNSYDEALGLPTEEAATLALRTQQVIAHESGVANTIDPLAGSYFVEAMTNHIEAEAYEYFERIEALGGVLPAIEVGFLQREIADAAYRYQREIDGRERIIVGVNEFAGEEPLTIPLLEMDPEGYRRQVARLEKLRAERDNQAVGAVLEAVRQAAEGVENLMPYLIDAVKTYATLGEITDVLREVFGTYREPDWI